MEFKPTGIKGFSRVYDDNGNECMSLAYFPPEEKEKSAKEMFEELGFVLYEDSEERVYYYKYTDEYGIENCEEIIFYKDVTKQIFIYLDCLTYDLLKAINKQVEELGWNND